MGKLRKRKKVLREGSFRLFESDDDILAFERYDSNKSIIVIVNYSNKDISVPIKNKYFDLFSKKEYNNIIKVEKSKIFIAEKKVIR
jgi:glycosidase